MFTLEKASLGRQLRTRWRRIRAYARYRRDWTTYAKLPGAELLLKDNAYPCVDDWTSTTPIDAHYFYQSVWATDKIRRSGTPSHTDVGSLAIYVGMLTVFTQVIFVDIRPLLVSLNNLESKPGSILNLPFNDSSISSLSCLHVAEHIGLGRYGDPLDPHGTTKAIRELIRVLAPNGNLYFSLPIGKSRVCFNAHRIHSPGQILEYFQDLTLVNFATVTDNHQFIADADPHDFADSDYACGMFHFTQKAG